MSNHLDDIENLINRGRFIEAVKTTQALISEDQDEPRLVQLQALAISKSGAPEDAVNVLEPLYNKNPEDPETAGILGGIYKNIFLKDQNPDFGMRSYETYLKNYQITKSYYTGINAATMSTLIGLAGKGRKIADEIISNLDENDFWQLATRAEAYLLKKEYNKAEEDYLRVRQLAGNDWGKVGTIKSQLWLLNHYIKVPLNITSLFKAPIIAAFIGHMIDHPDRAAARFPAEIEGAVIDAIRGAIRSLGVNIGFCSLACGSDILFAEAMLKEERELVIYLPFSKEDFLKTSVSWAGDDWTNRFEALYSSQSIRFVTPGNYNNDDNLFQFLGKTIMGSAIIRAQINDTQPYLITVLSSYDLQNRPGGTRDMIRYWRDHDRHQNIDLDGLRRSTEGNISYDQNSFEPPTNTIKHVMICNVELANDEDTNVLLSKIDAFRNEMITPFDHYSYGDGRIKLVHSTITQLSDILGIIISHLSSPVGIVCHSDRIEVENPEFNFIEEILSETKETSILATGNFAKQLALETTNYSFQYAGIIQISDNFQQDLFRLK